MQCPRCGNEKISVLHTIRNKTVHDKFNVHVDVRECQCTACKKSFPVECRLQYVWEYDKEQMKDKLVDIDTYQKEYLPLEGLSKRQLELGLYNE